MQTIANIIGLLGVRGSGKNTVGGIISESYGYESSALADEVRADLEETYGVSAAKLKGLTPEDREWRTQSNSIFNRLSPIEAMIAYAEYMRLMHGLDYWNQRFVVKHQLSKYPEKKLVITDIRRPFEIDFFRLRFNTRIIYVDRGLKGDGDPLENAHNHRELADVVLENYREIPDLKSKINNILTTFNVA